MKFARLQQDVSDQSGFSMVEMLVVLVLIGLLIAVGSGFVSQRHSAVSLAQFSRHLAGALNRERLDAIASGNPHFVRFEFDSEPHQIGGLSEKLEIPASFKLAVLTGAELTSSGSASLLFLPDGSSSGGSISIVDQGGARSKLDVNWLTGSITIELSGARP